MYEMAKKGRDAMKSKARRLAGEKSQKVDSSDFTPAEMLNADAKTGMRPVSRRAYKSGGKVTGEAADARADRKPRKAGGKAEQPPVDRFINRDLKKANDYRDGKKHVGGMNKGGRTGKMNGGAETANKITTPEFRKELEARQTPKTKPHVAPATKGAMDKPMDMSTMTANEAAEFMKSRKSGGRTKKMDGGLAMLSPLAMGINALRGDKDEKKSGGRAKRATGGKVGKKGTNINIVIQAGQKPAPADAGMMPPPPMPGGIPMPAPGASAPPMGGMGAGLPPGLPPMPAPPMGGGMPPMPRKSGGRVAKSYKDMTAGAGSGEGRLQKTEIQRSKKVRGA